MITREPLDTIVCDGCGAPVADDYGQTAGTDDGYVIFTRDACIFDGQTYCADCATDQDGWPLDGIWCEDTDPVPYGTWKA